MTEIFDFLKSIIDVICALVDFVITLVMQLGDLAKMLVEAATAIPSVFLIMPPAASVALASILSIAIIYKTLGRE